MQVFHPADSGSDTAESRPTQTCRLLHSNKYETDSRRSLHGPSDSEPAVRSGCPLSPRERIGQTVSPACQRPILPTGSTSGHRDRHHRPLLLLPLLHAFQVWVWSRYQNEDQHSPQLPPQAMLTFAINEFEWRSNTTKDGRPSSFQRNNSERPVQRDTNNDMTVPCATVTTVLFMCFSKTECTALANLA